MLEVGALHRMVRKHFTVVEVFEFALVARVGNIGPADPTVGVQESGGG